MLSKPIPIDPQLAELLAKSAVEYAHMPEIEKRRMNWDRRVSFVYGNVSLSNDAITREMVIEQVTKIYGPRP